MGRIRLALLRMCARVILPEWERAVMRSALREYAAYDEDSEWAESARELSHAFPWNHYITDDVILSGEDPWIRIHW